MSNDNSSGGTSTEANSTPPPWSNLQGVDINGSVKLTNTLLNGLNYQQWANAIDTALVGRGLLEFITGEFAKPDPITKPLEYKQWRKLDCQVLSLLQNSLELKIGEIFFNHKTSKELWDAITKHYGKRRNHSHIYHLKKRIQRITQNQRSILEYSTELTKGWEELKLYLLPTSEPNTLKERENEQVYQFLSGLDDSYEAIRAQILLSADLPPLDDVMAMVEGEETRRLLMADNSAGQEKPETHAMVAKVSNSRSGKRANWCENCKKEGHRKEKCWFLHRHLRPKWWKEKTDGKNGVAENPKGEKRRGFGAVVRNEEGVAKSKGEAGAQGRGSGSESRSGAALTRQDLGEFFAQITNMLKPKNNSGLVNPSKSNLHGAKEPN